jgi:hypothetical protein
MSAKNPLAYMAAGVAAVVLAFGAYAIGSSNSGNGAAAASQTTGGRAPQNGQMPPSGQAPPGFGTAVTGAAAAKVKAAVLAKYKGTIERIVKLPDGSYEAHLITSSGELHVAVSKDFQVTGTRQGGPGGAGGPGFGQDVTGAAAAKAKAAALARYPGTVERVLKLPDGSYVVHVLRKSGGEAHVHVSRTFAVLGLEQRFGGRRGAPPTGAPSGSGNPS